MSKDRPVNRIRPNVSEEQSLTEQSVTSVESLGPSASSEDNNNNNSEQQTVNNYNEIRREEVDENVDYNLCLICNQIINNRSRTDACDHQFCLACLTQWSDQHRMCSVCQSPYQHIRHNFRANGQYDTMTLPPLGPHVSMPQMPARCLTPRRRSRRRRRRSRRRSRRRRRSRSSGRHQRSTQRLDGRTDQQIVRSQGKHQIRQPNDRMTQIDSTDNNQDINDNSDDDNQNVDSNSSQ